MSPMEDRRADYLYEDEIDLGELIRKIWAKRFFIASLTTIILLSVVIFLFLKYPKIKETSSIISLNFKGMEKHMNPDGRLFDERQLITPYIVGNVYSKLKLKDFFSVTDLSDNLEVEPYLPDSEKEKMKKSKGEYKYFPNNFYIRIRTEGRDLFDGDENRRLIIKSLVSEYRDDFRKRYFRADPVKVKYEKSFLEENDFDDILQVFDKNIEVLIRFLEDSRKTLGDYNSVNLKSGFSVVEKQLQILRENDLENLKSTISVRKLTKFKNFYLDKLSYEMEGVTAERKIKAKELKAVENLLKKLMLEKNQKFSSKQSSGNLNINESFIDSLIEKDSNSFLVKKSFEISSELSHLQVKEEQLKVMYDEIKKNERSRNEDIKLFGKKIENLGIKIEEKSNFIYHLNEEFLKNRFQNLVQIVQPAKTITFRSVNFKLVGILAVFAGLFFSIIAVFLIDLVRPANIKE